MANIFGSINTLCDDNLVPYYNKLLQAIDSCPSASEVWLLRQEAEEIKALIDQLKHQMTAMDAKITKKYNK